MGTNYYAVVPECPNACAHCEQVTEVHICKSMTMFEAHETTPWGPVEKWQDWIDIFARHAPVIRDEYGTEWDDIEFCAAVDATSKQERRRQYDWVQEFGWDKEKDYLDDEGFSWHRGEFW
jgi:hypothetical protein